MLFSQWGCHGFDGALEIVWACLGWSDGPVKIRPKSSADSNYAPAMAA